MSDNITDLTLDWNSIFETGSGDAKVHFDSIPDALVHCICNRGEVDLEYISSVTGADYDTIIAALKGSIYQNPDKWDEVCYKGWETAEEYLSGNLMRKWRAATEANSKYNFRFLDNVKAIEAVLPPTVATKEIYITLGSPWVPCEIIDDFIEFLFGDPLRNVWCSKEYKDKIRNTFKTKHDEITGSWEIPVKNRYHNRVLTCSTYGTSRMGALEILEKTLNMKTIVITDEVNCNRDYSKSKRVINREESLSAIEKQKALIKAFQDWVWSDRARKEKLEKIFEDKFSCVRRRMFDGAFLEFPTMSKEITLYPYQKNAVARILFSPNVLLAHDVGAGKTYVMIAAGQELRRMNLSKKNMYVVPNNIVGQWAQIFKQMYPDASLLCVDPKSFKPEKREEVLTLIRDGEYDGIIIAYSCFEQIPLSKEYYREELREKKARLKKALSERKNNTNPLNRLHRKVAEELSTLSMEEDQFDGLCFDELGIDRLFVDEAHNFKNVPINTKANMVLGISSTGSKKCKDMLDKVHMIQKNNNGGGVVMATGTPITNSITDVFVMQLYLQSGELALLDLQNFDSWIGMFAEKRTAFEIDVDTSSYRIATRFSEFHNLPEMTALLSMIADFHYVQDACDVPVHDGYCDTLLPKTRDLERYLKKISERADNVRSGRIDRKEDNMLKITTDGRKAALDIRLVDEEALFSRSSKVAQCAENVTNIFYRTMAQKSTQLVFCDISTPKEEFNLYDELKSLLVSYGIPTEQIAYIHDATTERERTKLFAKVQAGEVRVVIGSTFKLGLGVNVQNKLIAIHHLDVPWRPADMTQREGRILRQGNENEKVEIYRYITEGSFDAYSWQLLETKQKFISDLLSGSMAERSGKEVDDVVLNYAEVKALAIGNPLVKERVEAQNELSRYRSLQKKNLETRIILEKELKELPGKIRKAQKLVNNCKNDAEYYKKQKRKDSSDFFLIEQEAEHRRQFREDLNAALKENEFKEKERLLTSYKGFDIILPAHMEKSKPYVWVKKNGKYMVEMADTQLGNIIRIDNFLEGLYERLGKNREALKKLETRANEIRSELGKNVSYADKIEFYQKKVKELDEKLGVNKE